jgi:hypothetical protein
MKRLLSVGLLLFGLVFSLTGLGSPRTPTAASAQAGQLCWNNTWIHDQVNNGYVGPNTRVGGAPLSPTAAFVGHSELVRLCDIGPAWTIQMVGYNNRYAQVSGDQITPTGTTVSPVAEWNFTCYGASPSTHQVIIHSVSNGHNAFSVGQGGSRLLSTNSTVGNTDLFTLGIGLC